MLMNGTLWTHLAEVDEQATDMFSRLVEQMKVNEGITEQLKVNDQLEWVARMDNIEARSREIVDYELIFTVYSFLKNIIRCNGIKLLLHLILSFLLCFSVRYICVLQF